MTRILLNIHCVEGDTLEIDGDEHHYLHRVRRHRAGDHVEVRTEQGGAFAAELISIDEEKAIVVVGSEIKRGGGVYPVRLYVAVPKRGLFEDIIRRSSELGVEELTPIICRRSVVEPGANKLERWRRIATESMRQCGRSSALTVGDVADFDEALERAAVVGQGLLFHPDGEGDWLEKGFSGEFCAPLHIFVGPEGGLTDEEVERAQAVGVRSVGLGENILRVETAAVSGAVLAVAMMGGLGHVL